METPDQIYGELFETVQLSGIFKDSKVFVDLIPQFSPKKILSNFLIEKQLPEFDLEIFVWDNFKKPITKTSTFKSNSSENVATHISKLWKFFIRDKKEKIEGSSLISLPHSYVVPGGRFDEMYYWDSYFTMLGLAEDGQVDLVENMVKNFAYLIDEFGHIPNGNRTYFLSRSQPPFFSLMIELLSEFKGQKILKSYLPFLEKEYHFWMNPDLKRVVEVNGFLLNKYFDNKNFPREESFVEDLNSKSYSQNHFLHLRAACESGWDFSSRWLADKKNMRTIRTSDYLPVDLNCLLFFLEKTISDAFKILNNKEKSNHYFQLSNQRAEAIRTVFFNEKIGAFVDLIQGEGQSSQLTLAMLFPLFFKIANQEQADTVAGIIESKFLFSGGLVTTLLQTGQQWDFPNGWAPLQWIAIHGLQNYGHQDLAKKIANRWMKLNEKVFQNTGQLMEKYNVVDLTLEAGGGEYDLQSGFGWTNGVYLAMKTFLKNSNS